MCGVFPHFGFVHQFKTHLWMLTVTLRPACLTYCGKDVTRDHTQSQTGQHQDMLFSMEKYYCVPSLKHTVLTVITLLLFLIHWWGQTITSRSSMLGAQQHQLQLSAVSCLTCLLSHLSHLSPVSPVSCLTCVCRYRRSLHSCQVSLLPANQTEEHPSEPD